MRVLVTGCAGHLGDALRRRLPALGVKVRGMDVVDDGGVDVVGSITDRQLVDCAMDGVDGVIHAAALHKPHVEMTMKSAFVETNVTGTLCLLEAAARAKVSAFVLTSTTSAFGRGLVDGRSSTATWIDERAGGSPKNIYGATKVASEDLGELVHYETGLPVVILRCSRFFPEVDDNPTRASQFDVLNLKVVELLYRRADLEDLVDAHVAALERATTLGFARLIVSATTPFQPDDRQALMTNAPSVVRQRCGIELIESLESLGWSLPPAIDRVYDNARARQALNWSPQYSFATAIARAAEGNHPFSDLSRAVGLKPYGRPLAS